MPRVLFVLPVSPLVPLVILPPPVNMSVSTLWPTYSLVEVARAWALARIALSFLEPDGWDATKEFAKSTRATTGGRETRTGLSVRDYYRSEVGL